jgi:hypothetical protein
MHPGKMQMPVAEKVEDQAVHPTIFMEPYRVPTLSVGFTPIGSNNWKLQATPLLKFHSSLGLCRVRPGQSQR